MRKRKVAILGATGTVGQRFIGLLQGHPWFEIGALTTSDAKAGKRYGDVTPWHWSGEMPAAVAGMTLQPTTADLDAEVCFSALPADAAEQWEAALAKTGHHVFSNVKPVIAEEEEKMEQETKKFLGTWDGKRFVDATFAFSAHCNRVAVRDGHTETVSVALRGSPSPDAVKEAMREFRGRPQELKLP